MFIMGKVTFVAYRINRYSFRDLIKVSSLRIRLLLAAIVIVGVAIKSH